MSIWTSVLTVMLLAELTNPVMAENEKTMLNTFERHLKEASRVHQYQPVSGAERKKAQALFMRTMRETYSEDLATAWAALSMKLSQVPSGEEVFTVLQESSGTARGRGWYLFRQPNISKNALQSPHCFKDLGSRKIGLAWMLEGKFGAGAFNTVPRDYVDEEGTKVIADMGKEQSTYFMAFTIAWARVHREGAILQLHGYAKNNRRFERGNSFDAVLSSCQEQPSEEVRALALDLSNNVDCSVAVYPLDTLELAGKLNVQAIGLRYEGFHRFIHLEICREERDRLVADATLRKRWLSCLERNLNPQP